MVASLTTSRGNTSGGFPEWSAWIESKIALQSVGRDGKGSSGRQETMKASGKKISVALTVEAWSPTKVSKQLPLRIPSQARANPRHEDQRQKVVTVSSRKIPGEAFSHIWAPSSFYPLDSLVSQVYVQWVRWPWSTSWPRKAQAMLWSLWWVELLKPSCAARESPHSTSKIIKVLWS